MIYFSLVTFAVDIIQLITTSIAKASRFSYIKRNNIIIANHKTYIFLRKNICSYVCNARMHVEQPCVCRYVVNVANACMCYSLVAHMRMLEIRTIDRCTTYHL